MSIVFLILLLLAGGVIFSFAHRRRMKKKPLVTVPSCAACLYNVTGLPSMTCPECGSDLETVGILRPEDRRPTSRIYYGYMYTLLILLVGLISTPLLLSIMPPPPFTVIWNATLQRTPGAGYTGVSLSGTQVYTGGVKPQVPDVMKMWVRGRPAPGAESTPDPAADAQSGTGGSFTFKSGGNALSLPAAPGAPPAAKVMLLKVADLECRRQWDTTSLWEPLNGAAISAWLQQELPELRPATADADARIVFGQLMALQNKPWGGAMAVTGPGRLTGSFKLSSTITTQDAIFTQKSQTAIGAPAKDIVPALMFGGWSLIWLAGIVGIARRKRRSPPPVLAG